VKPLLETLRHSSLLERSGQIFHDFWFCPEQSPVTLQSLELRSQLARRQIWEIDQLVLLTMVDLVGRQEDGRTRVEEDD
jgi:hypothetical protein